MKRQYVATVGEFGKQDFGFGGRVVPGFYRLSVEIRSFDRKALGRYAELFRAVPPRSDERLVASFSTLSPGQTGYLRVDNFGTMPAVYGLGYRIFNRDGEEVPLEGIVFSDILLRLQAGYSGHCFPFKAPAKVSAGDYLILVEAGDSLRGLGPVTATVTID